MTKSSVIDANSFTSADDAMLSASDRNIIERSRRIIGPNFRVFYRSPVHLVRGNGSYVFDDTGRRYLDAYNNVPSLGHCHPAVVEAVHRQMQTFNSHTRYIHRSVADYGEKLLATMPVPMDHLLMTNSGSEANDLALRVAKRATGGTGVIVTSEAYHGTTACLAGISPSLGSAHLIDPDVEAVQLPEYGLGAEAGIRFKAEVDAAIERMRQRGVKLAALLVDTIFASDGIHDEPTILGPAVDAVHAAGGLFIADEVQPGFGRTGARFWGFARHDVAPDLVTMGKPMGNGIPVAGMAATAQALEPFGTTVPYFNTFGGTTVSVAAATATLDVMLSQNLAQHSETMGKYLRTRLERLAAGEARIRSVRQAGLFIGVEFASGPERDANPDSPFALEVMNTMRELGVLISIAGKDSNVLKMRPLLSYTETEADLLVDTLAESIAAAHRVMATGR